MFNPYLVFSPPGGTNKDWDPVVVIWPPQQQESYIPFNLLLLDPFWCCQRPGFSKRGPLQPDCKDTSRISIQQLPHREQQGHEQNNEQRGITQVQPLCAAKLLKRRLQKQQRWHQWAAPFCRIRDADGTRRSLAAGKGSKPEVRLQEAPFWRIQGAHSTKRGPAAGKGSKSEVRLRGTFERERERKKESPTTITLSERQG